MKKLMILVSAVALSGTMFAQKGTTDNPWTLEGTVNVTTSGGVKWDVPSVRARYFFKDNMAGRVSLNFDNSSDSTKGSSNTIGLGFEYHLAGNDKMSPYFTAGAKFGGENKNDTKSSSLGFGIGAGLDYYVAENIYVGLELNLLSFTSETIGDADALTNLGLGGGSAIRMGWRF
jgi:opacity protein-like surface antigen